MKRLFICISFLFAACSSDTSLTIPYYSSAITFASESAEYYPGNKIKKVKLTEVAVLGGRKCINWLQLFPNGQIKQFETAEDFKRADYIVPAKSTVIFDEKNPTAIQYVLLSRDTLINGVYCKGGGQISTEFYPGGELKACFLAKDQIIKDIPCKSSLTEPVYFYPDGRVRIATLSADLNQSGSSFRKGETILVGDFGMLSKLQKK